MNNINNGKNSNGVGSPEVKKDCIFCKIANKKIPSNLVFENEEAVAFLDINPVQFGHLLITPKDHHPQMTDLPENLLAKLFGIAKMIMPHLKKATDSDFVVLTVVGTDIDHFHIHLIPRREGDGLSGFFPTKKYESEKEMSAITFKIKEEIEKKN